MCVCEFLAFLLLCGHPPIMPGFSGVPQGLGPFGVHHHIVHTCTAAPRPLHARSGLLAATAAAAASTFCRAAFLLIVRFVSNYTNLLIDSLQKRCDIQILNYNITHTEKTLQDLVKY